MKASTRSLMKKLKVSNSRALLSPVANPGTNSLQKRRASLAAHRKVQLAQSRKKTGNSKALRSLVSKFHESPHVKTNSYQGAYKPKTKYHSS